MASVAEAQAELISSLSPDDIPIKLRCAICSKLAINAFRLPCCEQAICETCQSNLPPSCPVCEHSPLSAEDCNPNKSLRTTIRVFLRTAEKKREASRPKETKDSAPPTPVEAPKQSLPAVEPPVAGPPAEENHGADGQLAETVSAPKETRETGSLQPADDDINGQDTTIPQPDGVGEPKAAPADEGEGEPGAEDSNEQALVEKDDGGDQAGDDEENYDSEAMNGGFPNPNFSGSGDMNQMQMMMAMQNGMTPNGFGGFPMMSKSWNIHTTIISYPALTHFPGMPGMGMDPMTMQNMFMNGGFQGMGMNGMGGFGGGFGQGSNNNWNGSQSWNFDQNNYNQNGPGMGTGDFGNFNSGFQTGYNQGNYGHFNDYRRNNFGRGRGRGRGYYGGYGRGGYQFGGNASYQDQGQMSQFGSGVQGQGQGQTDNSGAGGQGESAEGQDVDEYGRAVRAEVADGDDKTNEAASGGDPTSGDQDPSREALGNEAGGDVPTGPNMGSAGNPHQRNGSGTIRSVVVAPDVPINAPTGPKAMRQGLPNTSLLNLRARGYQVGGEAPLVKPHVSARESPAERGRTKSNSPEPEKDKDNVTRPEQSKDRSRGRDKRDKEHDDGEPDNTGSRSRTASRSRSQSRDHRSSRRRRRHRSESAEDEGYDDESRRKKHKSRRHYHEDEESSRPKDKDDKYTERSRSASPADSKRSGHRSRRDRDSDKRRDRERDNSRRHSTDGPDTPAEKDFKPPTGPRGHDAKGSSSKADSSTRDKDKDPHTLEREARDRERLLKEAQRIAGLGWKRNRDGDDDVGSGSRKGRRTASSSTAAAGAGRRSEAVSGGDEEERMRRLEAEREGDRWR
ncbi:hypothetical protein AUP68_01293 [Ilyonectria robusta]